MHWGLLSDRSDALSFACLVRNFYICMTAFVGNISSSPSYIGDLLLPSFRVIIFYHHIWLQSRFLSCSCWMTMRAPSTSRCWWNHVPGAGAQVQVSPKCKCRNDDIDLIPTDTAQKENLSSTTVQPPTGVYEYDVREIPRL